MRITTLYLAVVVLCVSLGESVSELRGSSPNITAGSRLLKEEDRYSASSTGLVDEVIHEDQAERHLASHVQVSWYNRHTNPATTPIWQTWNSEKAFCQGQGQRLCSYQELCPSGAGSSPSGFSANNDRWVAVADSASCSHNGWVQIGPWHNGDSRHRCKRHEDWGYCPSWGLHQQAGTAYYHENIACCGACTRPNGWCTHAGSKYSHVDCDGDGLPDHSCYDKTGRRGIIASASGCASTWPSAPEASCPAAFGNCARGNWCTHHGATYQYWDCSGNGQAQHVCSDTAGRKGFKHDNCGHNWPVGGSCPGVFSDATDSNGQYVGCFRDESSRAMVGKDYGWHHTIESCIDKCAKDNFPFAGIQAGSYCFCGNKYDRYGAAPRQECSSVAPGGGEGGGNWRNSVYRTGHPAPFVWWANPNGTPSITPALTNRAYVAAVLSHHVYEADPSWSPPSASQLGGATQFLGHWNDGDDQAMVMKVGSTCYGALRGTTLTMDDWKQNLQIPAKAIPGAAGCNAHEGLINTYYTHYQAQFESALQQCQKSCGADTNCEVVLTGHSQGGGTAVVASAVLSSMNPYAITFGAPQTVQPGCYKIRGGRHFRFVLAGKGFAGTYGFDFAPVLDNPGCDHYGHEIVVGSDTNSVMIGDGRRRDPPVPDLHSIGTYYQPRLEKLKGRTVPGNGWGRGSQCAYNEECHGYCAKYLVDGKCCNHNEYNDLGNCKGKLANRSFCLENRVCQSGNCHWGLCT